MNATSTQRMFIVCFLYASLRVFIQAGATTLTRSSFFKPPQQTSGNVPFSSTSLSPLPSTCLQWRQVVRGNPASDPVSLWRGLLAVAPLLTPVPIPASIPHCNVNIQGFLRFLCNTNRRRILSPLATRPLTIWTAAKRCGEPSKKAATTAPKSK